MNDAPTQMRSRPSFTDTEKVVLRRFLRGEITFAQLEGMTAHEAQAVARMGHELFRRGRLADARTLFEGLSALNPLDPYPHQVLGAICEREGEPAAARKHYDVCLSLAADNAWVLARRGELRLEAGEAEGGVEDLSRAIRLDGEGRLGSTGRARLILAALVEAARRAGAAGAHRPAEPPTGQA